MYILCMTTTIRSLIMFRNFATSTGLGDTQVQLPTGKHTGTVVFLHGSGGNGLITKEWIKMLRRDAAFPHLKIIFPTAPLRPYTPAFFAPSNVWFDRIQISPDSPEQLQTLDPTAQELKQLIQKEIDSGIPFNRIVVGGFSMGGAMALHLGYRFVPQVAGVFALSSFLNEDSAVYKELEKNKPEKSAPLFYAHGDRDDMVPLFWGEETFSRLQKQGVEGQFHVLKHTLHELKAKEIDLVYNWINEIVPNNNN